MAKKTKAKPSVVAKVNGVPEIAIYGDIDPVFGVSAKSVRDALEGLGDVKALTVRINSSGGSIFEGLAIYSLLVEHPAKITVKVDGIALSMASILAMTGDVIEAAENSWFMIHNPMSGVYGESEDMRHWADLLDKMKSQLVSIYAKRTKQEPATISEFMDLETWFTAAEAVDIGLADRITDQLAVAASFDAKRFHHVPESVFDRAITQTNGDKIMTTEKTAAAEPATFSELKAALPKASADFLVRMQERQATLDQARSEYVADMETRTSQAEKAAADAKAAAEEAEKAKAAAEKAKAENTSGVEKLPSGSATEKSESCEDPVASMDAMVRERMAAGMERHKAVKAVAKANPEIFKAYLMATNSGRRSQRLLSEKFDDE